MSQKIAIVAEADKQLQDIDGWWRANRGAAPDLFLDELQQALDLLEEFPAIGAPYQHPTRRGIRRMLLKRSNYWIYYTHDRRRSIIYILAIWSTFRGSDPELPFP